MAKNSESLVLQNSEFAQNHVIYYRELMEYQEMTDITLACDDDSSIEAHKFILCASSPFFRNIIRNSRHQSPYVYLKGIKMEDLQAIITFMYTGETKVNANDMKRFLTTAHELKVAGLILNKEKGVGAKERTKQEEPLIDTLSEEMESEESQEIEIMAEDIENEVELEVDTEVSDLETSKVQASKEENEGKIDESLPIVESKDKPAMKETTKKERKQKEKTTVDPEDLKREMNTRIKYVFDRALQKPVYVCIECNLTFQQKGAREHVEVHMKGNGVICTNCGAIFRGPKTLADHSETCNLNID